MKYFVIALLLVTLLLAALLYGLIAIFGRNLPTPHTPGEMESSVSTRILDRQGRIIDELYVEDRVPLSLADVPPAFLQAILSTEDRQFYGHWGVNPISFLRAVKANILRGWGAQGASTITQQLAWNLFLDHRRTLGRKIREAILALRIERSFSKDEILEMYVNQIYFGEGAYGLEAAARRFFGVSARELTLEQCALLAGIPGNPAAFSPRRHPEASLHRRNLVLRAMRETGAIDESTYREAVGTPLALREAAPGSHPGAYFTEMVRQELARRYGTNEIYHAGLVVETTLDLDMQRIAEESLESHLRLLEEKNAYAYLWGRPDLMLAGHALAESLQAPLRLQGAVAAIQPTTGAVRVLVGGRDFAESSFNRAVQAKRQPGSAFKPFVYAEAIRQGHRTTEILIDEPMHFEIPGAHRDSLWSPLNFSHTYRGAVTLRTALAKSLNIPTVRLLQQVGVSPVVALAQRLGIGTPLPRVISLGLGSGEVRLIEMTSAFGVLANNGIRVEPYLIQRVLDRHGHVLEIHEAQSEEVLDAQTCYIVTDLLRSAIDRGTGYKARSEWGLVGPLAGKTGTSDDYADAWFVGYSPDLSVGVWVGFDVKLSIGGSSTGTGSNGALPIWARIMRAAEEHGAYRDFEMPSGLRRVRTCEESGLLASPRCPRVVDDIFRIGTEPSQVCRAEHRELPEFEDESPDVPDSTQAQP